MYAEMRKLNIEAARSIDETLRLRAETDKAEAQTKKAEADAKKADADAKKADADATKLTMETLKIQLEVRWFPYAVVGTMIFTWIGIAIAFVHALVKLLSL